MDAARGPRWRGDRGGVGGVLPAVVSLRGAGKKRHLTPTKALFE